MANIFLPFYRLRTGNRKSNNPIETLSVGVIRDQSVHRQLIFMGTRINLCFREVSGIDIYSSLAIFHKLTSN